MYSLDSVVLSRKSFDSASGHGYSPFDPATGRYIIVPIPLSQSEQQIANKTRYEEIEIRPNHLPGVSASNLKELLFHRSLRFGRRARDAVSENSAHVDPWLGPCPWLAEKSNHHVGAFGQAHAAQGHLAKNGVGVGSLFLFFSRFTPIRGSENTFGSMIVPEKGAYFLYGWLRVGRVASTFSDIRDPEIEARHPHATELYFETRKNNAIYIASPFLYDHCEIPGCGYFPTLSRELLLTSEDHRETPTVWALPEFFYEPQNRPTFLKEESRWQLSADATKCFVRIPSRGQEFVFKGSHAFHTWFNRILQRVI